MTHALMDIMMNLKGTHARNALVNPSIYPNYAVKIPAQRDYRYTEKYSVDQLIQTSCRGKFAI